MFQGCLNYSYVSLPTGATVWHEGTDKEAKHRWPCTVDQRTPLDSCSIMWPPRYICKVLERHTPPFLPSAIPGCAAEVRVVLAQSERVASEQEWNHQIPNKFPGNLCVIRESKHTGRTPFSSDGQQLTATGLMRTFSLRLLKSSSGEKWSIKFELWKHCEYLLWVNT